MFDWLLLLQPGGQTVFFGPVGELVPFFVENKIAESPADKDSPDLNVADFALDAIRSAKAKRERGEEAVDMVAAFKKTERYSQIQAELDKITTGQTVDANPDNQQRDIERGPASPAAVNAHINANGGGGQVGNVADANPDVAAAEADSNYAGFLSQLVLLTRRNMKNQWRNRLTIRTRYFTALVLGFVCGTLFFRLDHSQAAAQTRVSVLFSLTIIPMFLSSSALAEVFAVRPLYFREHTSRMYGALSWFVARRLADIPYMIVEMVRQQQQSTQSRNSPLRHKAAIVVADEPRASCTVLWRLVDHLHHYDVLDCQHAPHQRRRLLLLGSLHHLRHS